MALHRTHCSRHIIVLILFGLGFTSGYRISQSSGNVGSTVRVAKGIAGTAKEIQTTVRIHTLVIGLCGGIASGKSTIRKKMELLGAKTVDADILGHDSYAPGTAGFYKVKKEFEPMIKEENLFTPLVDSTTGEIDRKVLGKLVFDLRHPGRIEKLNSIVWPIIANMIQERINFHKANKAPVVIVEAAVLLEAGWDYLFDEIWAAEVDENVAVKRLVDRTVGQRGKAQSGQKITAEEKRGIEEQSRLKIHRQKKDGVFAWRQDDPRVAVALSNDGSLEDLDFQIAAACLRRLLPLASCLPEEYTTAVSDADQAILKALHVAPLSMSAGLDRDIMESLVKCMGGTKNAPGQLIRVVTGRLGTVANLASRLSNIYAGAVRVACEVNRMNTEVDVILDYLQDSKSVSWLAKLLAEGFRPMSSLQGVCDMKGAPPWRFDQSDVDTVLPSAPSDIDEFISEHTAVGGTFDHLHAGHKTLLTMTAVLGLRRISVGVTSDAMSQQDQNKKCANFVQIQSQRQAAVVRFLNFVAPDRIVSTGYLSDVWGPAARDASISLLVVTDEFRSQPDGSLALDGTDKFTRAAANMRKENNLPAMRLFWVPLVTMQCEMENVSKFGSSGIRMWLYGENCSQR